MPATGTPPAGELREAGKAHGAANYILVWYDDPNDWEFKQFVAQEQLEQFAAEHNLIIVKDAK